MTIRITTLTENTASWLDLLAEWGVSILVEVDGYKVLLDAGPSFVATHNAAAMGIDLSQVDRIFLSHGHDDHTGGLLYVLRAMRKRIEVIAHPDIWASKYFQTAEKKYRYIGVAFPQEAAESLGASFNLTKEPVWITDNIVTSGEVPMVTEYEKIDTNLYVKEGNDFSPDPLWDDQSLFIKSPEGLIVILGCAHRGIINNLKHARNLTGVESIHTVIGGTHLGLASPQHVQSAIAELKHFGIKRLGVSHCTGLPVACLLAHEFGDKFFFNNAGTQFDL